MADCPAGYQCRLDCTLELPLVSIASPNYPGSYPRNKVCRWMADCPAGYQCRLDCTLELPLCRLDCPLELPLVSIASPNYPGSYSRSMVCRWMADCPAGYQCRLDCTLELPLVSIASPNYPGSYPRSKVCRWMADCPAGYQCRLDCTLELPPTTGCSGDRVLISRTGDPQFYNAQTYCGRQKLTAILSVNQSIGLETRLTMTLLY
ncbi:Uncharacterized protein OBRU01_03754 [Operophtera brumata]|uniref:CUB domain-containing protein n=1 Tax=Operophtera brumata TaxID=104452 RepID=A0A0L7LQC1_OPEBR|nr:Uncharacterized protein OBRU01_03754 [Operophtera brumata]